MLCFLETLNQTICYANYDLFCVVTIMSIICAPDNDQFDFIQRTNNILICIIFIFQITK